MIRTRAFRLLNLTSIAFAAFAVLPALASAAVITVNTTADQAPVLGQCSGAAADCSLRQAIGTANNLPGPDTIVLPAGQYALTIKGPEEDLDLSGDLDISAGSEIAIQGAGARTTVIDASGIEERVLDVLPLASLSLSKLTVTGGRAVGVYGGGIQAVEATLNLDQVAVRANVSAEIGRGGGLALGKAKTTVANSLIAENRNSGDGGGVWIEKGEASFVNTTIANNVAETALYPTEAGWGAYGGAVEVDGGFLGLQNVTIAGNRIIDNNGGGEGSGAAFSGGPETASIVNTIVYGNSGTEVEHGGQCNEEPPILSDGHNLEQQPPPGEPRCFAAATDLIADPLLGPLADNGGETDTMALAFGSPAIDAGDVARCPATDQRGVARPQVHGCDIGAYEFVPPPPTIRRHGKVKVKRAGKTFLVKPGFVVSCPAGTESCGGSIKARWKKGLIGKKSFTIAPGKSMRLSLKLVHRGAKLLRQRGKIRAKFEVASRTGTSEQATAMASLKLKLPRGSLPR
jgi:hypothetical protein